MFRTLTKDHANLMQKPLFTSLHKIDPVRTTCLYMHMLAKSTCEYFEKYTKSINAAHFKNVPQNFGRAAAS